MLSSLNSEVANDSFLLPTFTTLSCDGELFCRLSQRTLKVQDCSVYEIRKEISCEENFMGQAIATLATKMSPFYTAYRYK